MAQTHKKRQRRAVAASDPTAIRKQVITPGELEDGGKLYPARGLPGGSGILPEAERDKPEVVLTEFGLTVRKQIRADAESLFFFARLPKALDKKLTGLSKGLAADAGVDAEEVDHVTVLYLKSSNGALSESLVSDAVKAAQKALEGMAPLEATLQGWGYFDGAKKDGKATTALVALLDCLGLAEAHVALKAAMEGLGLPMEEQTHGYVPHATVAYLDAGDRVDNLPTLGAEFRIDALELMHVEPHVLKLSGAKREKRSKRLELAPDTDPSELSNKELLQAHWQLHLLFRDDKARTAAKFSTEDVTNLHALVVDELFGRGRKHPAPPDEGLDDVSSDFERHVEEQPDWTKVPEKRAAKQELAPIHSSGVERGEEIKLAEVLPYFKSFKTKKPYVYLVGGLVNRGVTKGDIDILVKDTEDLPEDFRHVLRFRLGRMLPPELAKRLEIHYDNFHGPFTRFVELYDLTFERVNPENEVKEMREEEAEKRLAKPFRSPGGKDVWAKWIVSNIPEHDVYVEPYAGGASVFFAKEPSEKEVLADVNQDVIDTFTFLKSGSDSDFEWVRTQKWKWSEKQFRKLLESKPGSLREKAYRFKYLNLFSQRGRGRKIDDSETCKGFTGRVFLSNLEKFRERLKDVALFCKDALTVMKEQDGKNTFFYLDPPWKPESASEEWKNFDVNAFQKACKGLKGKVFISYQGDLDLAEENEGGGA